MVKVLQLSAGLQSVSWRHSVTVNCGSRQDARRKGSRYDGSASRQRLKSIVWPGAEKSIEKSPARRWERIGTMRRKSGRVAGASNQ